MSVENSPHPISGLPPAVRHGVVARDFAEQIAAVTNWDAPTPVPEWTARDIVGHLLDWFPGFLAGGNVELPATTLTVDDDPAAAWAERCASVQDLLDGPRAEDTFAHPMIGELRLADAIDRFYTADVFMHTWDLGAAAGAPPELDSAFAALLLDGMSTMEEILRSSGQYGPAVPVADDADPVSRLAGFIGRDPAWHP